MHNYHCYLWQVFCLPAFHWPWKTNGTGYLVLVNCWRIDNPSVGEMEMMYGPTKVTCIYIHNTQCHLGQSENWIIKLFVSLAAHTAMTLHAFPHLSEHQTSFQGFCQYLNCAWNHQAFCLTNGSWTFDLVTQFLEFQW